MPGGLAQSANRFPKAAALAKGLEARQRVAMQKTLISNLEREERGTRGAPARLRRSEVMLQLLEDHREAILENVQRSLLPGCSILKF